MIGHRLHLTGEVRHRLLLLGERRLGIIDHWSYLIARFAGTDLDGWRRPAAQTALLTVGFPEPLERELSRIAACRKEPLNSAGQREGTFFRRRA